MTCGFLVGSKNFCKLFCVSWSFCFAWVWLYPLCCQVLHHHGVSMIVSRFTSFTENFVIRCYWITIIFRYGNDCTSASLARSLCKLGSQTDIAVSVLREESKNAVLNWYHFCSRLWIHEKNWKRLGVLEHFHLASFPWNHTAILADHATSFLVLLRCHHFYLGFLFLLVHTTGFLYTSSLILSLLVDAGCSVGVTAFLRWSCRRSKWRWSWRTRQKTRDNEWHVVRSIFDEMWFLTTGPKVKFPVIFAEFSEWKNCPCIIKKHNCHE